MIIATHLLCGSTQWDCIYYALFLAGGCDVRPGRHERCSSEGRRHLWMRRRHRRGKVRYAWSILTDIYEYTEHQHIYRASK